MKREEFLHEVMQLAWQFVRRNGLSKSEAMKLSWANLRLRGKMKKGVVYFRFMKTDGTVREAFGTLNNGLMPAIKGTGKKEANDAVQAYFDTACGEFRSYRKINLLSIA